MKKFIAFLTLFFALAAAAQTNIHARYNFTDFSVSPLGLYSVWVRAGGKWTPLVQWDSSEAVLTRMDAGGDLTVAAFGIYRVRETATSAAVEGGSGFVARYKAAKFALSFSGPRFGPCVVYDRTYPVGGLDPASPEALLDAGATLPLSGPNLPQGAGLGRGAGPMGPYYFFLPASGTFAAGTPSFR